LKSLAILADRAGQPLGYSRHGFHILAGSDRVFLGEDLLVALQPQRRLLLRAHAYAMLFPGHRIGEFLGGEKLKQDKEPSQKDGQDLDVRTHSSVFVAKIHKQEKSVFDRTPQFAARRVPGRDNQEVFRRLPHDFPCPSVYLRLGSLKPLAAMAEKATAGLMCVKTNMATKSKAPWNKPAPKKSRHTKLSAKSKSQAKAAAKRAGRKYPSLVDNMNAAKNQRSRSSSAKKSN
jgi:hypothetical protein